MRKHGLYARGRNFTPLQVAKIVDIVDRYGHESRTRISVRVCRALRWRQENGDLKDMACREVLRRLESLGVLSLPPRQRVGATWKPPECQPVEDQSPIMSIDLRTIEFKRVTSKFDTTAIVWNSLVTQYHYLNSSRIVGRQLKYVVCSGGRPLGCFGWGEAAWAQAARDEWIGWNQRQRDVNRHRIVNNCRFLVLPWIRVPNLASHLIARCTRLVATDWLDAFGTSPLLLETFVDSMRFAGTCYRAANWTDVGMTSGYAKTGNSHHNSQTPKHVLVYPLRNDVQQALRRIRR